MGLAVVLASCGPQTRDVPSTRSPAAQTPAASAAVRPQVPPIRACDLLTLDETDEALGMLDLPMDERNFFTRGGREGCSWQRDAPADDPAEARALQISPGNPDDFLPEARVAEVPGRTVQGIWLDGRWFGASAGVLSIVADSSLGLLFVRVAVERPDLDDVGRLAVASKVAGQALPRFPGMEAVKPEPALVRLEHEPVDNSAEGYVENLLVKEAAGEWSRGDGLVASLRVAADEQPSDGVLRHADLESFELTGLLELAFDYLGSGGADAATKAEVQRLVEQIVFTSDQLEAMAGSLPTAVLAGRPPVAQGSVENCDRFFKEFPPDVSTCLEFRSTTVNGKTYRVFYPAPPLSAGGWTEAQYEAAVQAIADSVTELDPYGEAPPASLVFTLGGGYYAYAEPFADEPCAIAIGLQVQAFDLDDLKQVIAHELGHCFNFVTFPAQKELAYELRRWWDEGLADYLSNLVYKTNNLEYTKLDALSEAELSTTLFDRSYSNWAFFQSLENQADPGLVMRTVKSLPAGGHSAQAAALAAVGGMPELLHNFTRALTDVALVDTGGGLVPYRPRADEVAISGPVTIEADPTPFGVVRIQFRTPESEFACLEYETEGTVRASWRNGFVGRLLPGGWTTDLPSQASGPSTFLVTSTAKPATFTIRVTDLSDTDCEEQETEKPELKSCLELICGPSDYYRYRDDITELLRDLWDL
jgi:hypothetical protein